jgi:hypothetical protein
MKKTLLTFALIFSLFAVAAPIRSRLASAETDYLSPLSPLPYGAIPVQYIESTGTQYIDTGILPLNGFQLECLLQVISSNDGNMGVVSSSPAKRDYLNFYANKIYPRFGNGFPSGKITIGKNKVSVVFNRQDLFIDGIAGEYVFNDIDDSVQTDSFYLFAANKNGAVGSFCLLRIFSVTLSNYGEVEFDAIPVRFPNELGEWEGAMYDFVSGELFRNQGTGPFIIGPDL